ncbi:hypothetical protein FIBSPDRAFT_953578 [Athelia psychrophila]|uniref:Uncharacterized protein n=1 Tax=Athelia psychrophila TaxID=1759441 RepID=A0A166K5T1_9AGAM|nr:hypothetical protein FIBSPDRAFT_953578 [Fibularhizoctonia sp. CBS 109695]
MAPTDSSGLISTDEMEKFLATVNPNLRDRYFQHLVRGWMKFVAPLTPAQSPVERIPESIRMLLAAVSETAFKAEGQLSGSALLPFRKAWPTMWIWTRHMYRVHQDRVDLLRLTMDAARKAHSAERYDSDEVVAGILQSLIQHANQPVISKILSDHPDIFAMMADMWIREAKDKEAVCGFRAGSFTESGSASEQRFVAQVILACGGAEEAVNLACQRVERNTGRTTQDYNSRIIDLHFFAVSMSNAECPIAPAMLASPRVARVLMRTWAHAASELFSAPVELRDAYIDICMVGTTMLLESSPRAHEILRDILNLDFIPLCLNSIPLVRSGSGDRERFIKDTSTVLHILLPSATAHREIFSIMQRSMTSPKLKFLPKDQHDLISTDEMERFMEMINPNLRDRYFQHLIQGWMKFVAPITPSDVDDVPRLKCVQDAQSPAERIPESICMLLAAVSETAFKAEGQLSGSALLPFRKAWPTMWIWTRHMYRVHQDRVDLSRLKMDAAQKSHFTERYHFDEVMAGILRSLIDHAKQPVISKILSDHPEIFAMMADMWIREAKDKEAVYGFRSGFYSESGDASEQRFVAHIILACGGAEEAVNLACQRVERNTGRTTQDYNTHFIDLHFLAASMSNAECPIAPAMLASPRVARVLMRAWAHAASELFSAPVELRDAYMDICMSGTNMLLERSPRAYEILRDILNHDFIPLCLNSIPLVRSGSGDHESFIQEACSLLSGILPPATVHREILSIMQRSITSPKLIFLPKDQHDVLTKGCRDLWHTIQQRGDAYHQHRQDRSRCILLCGNVKVSALADLV